MRRMALHFQIDADRRDRLAAVGFDPSKLSQEYFAACDLCGWKVFRTISRVDRYGFPGIYQMCEGCGLIFQNPHPTKEAYAEFYQKWYRPLITAYWGEAIDAKTVQADQGRYAEWLISFLRPFIKDPIELAVDLGGSTGVIAQAFQGSFGGRCIVVDPAPEELAEAASFHLEHEQALAEDWDPYGRKFDVILLCRSIDHLLSISKVLNKVASALKQGGYFFVDFVDFSATAETMSDYREILKLDHVYYNSDDTLRSYLNAAGFEVVASDFTVHQPALLTRYTGQITLPRHQTDYSMQIAAMLRERLITPPPPRPPEPRPVDVLTRIEQRLRSTFRKVIAASRTQTDSARIRE
jgi:SAM-dependent methyltransferase